MKRTLDKAAILTDAEVAFLAKQLQNLMAESFPGLVASMGDSERIIRMMALSENCKNARESRGLSIKEVAAHMRVPQYRLRAVEDGSMNSLQPQCLRAYLEFLGLTPWARRWAAANPALAERLEIADL